MKTLNNVLNRLSLFNSGYDIRNRSTPVKFVVVVGFLTAIGLVILGAIHLINP